MSIITPIAPLHDDSPFTPYEDDEEDDD